MHPPTFNQQFQQIALERIEYVRLHCEKKDDSSKQHDWEANLKKIEQFLPADQKHLIEHMKDLHYKMNDDYDIQIFKQGFADGFLFYKDILEQQSMKK